VGEQNLLGQGEGSAALLANLVASLGPVGVVLLKEFQVKGHRGFGLETVGDRKEKRKKKGGSFFQKYTPPQPPQCSGYYSFARNAVVTLGLNPDL